MYYSEAVCSTCFGKDCSSQHLFVTFIFSSRINHVGKDFCVTCSERLAQITCMFCSISKEVCLSQRYFRQGSIRIQFLHYSFTLNEHICISLKKLAAYFVHKLFSSVIHKNIFCSSHSVNCLILQLCIAQMVSLLEFSCTH
ncbi:hypothetical protein AMECASPLE_026347 [Ameca splendens]|uniref:Uncharacterized protein n=1 Tax=Ameca splendens TaxID=208324 RepID=A0ABV0ZQX4_9TELE